LILVLVYPWLVGWFMVFNTTFNNISIISWRSTVLLVEETGVPGENNRPVAHQNQNIFFSNIGNQNIFLEKKT
jgi:hypothetical protein